jgi:hypothetical protein
MALQMFARFQERKSRLNVSLIANRRIGGKVKQEHIAALGSIDAGHLLPGSEMSVRNRAAFWDGVNERLSNLANRIGPDAAKIRDAIAARIPIPTADELAAIPEWEANEELERWKSIEDSLKTGVELATAKAEAFENFAKQNRDLIAGTQSALDGVSNIVKGGPDPKLRTPAWRDARRTYDVSTLGMFAGLAKTHRL